MAIELRDVTKPTITVNSVAISDYETKLSDTQFRSENIENYRYAGPVTVAMSTTVQGGKITFTLDGRRPTRHSTLYTASFQLHENSAGCDSTVIKARVWCSDGTSSPTKTIKISIKKAADAESKEDPRFVGDNNATYDNTELNATTRTNAY
jgi:hypothetical protein